jgi:hypothetical protein
MGGLLESLLLARVNLEPNKGPVYTAKSTPKDKAGKAMPLSEWKLVAMVGVAHEVGWITKSAKDVGNILRDFRYRSILFRLPCLPAPSSSQSTSLRTQTRWSPLPRL